MTTTYDTDPNTQTIAAAWASSELGQPDHEVGFDTTGPTELATTSEEEPTARRVMVATGLACGIAAGALLGVMLFANTGSPQPTVVAPGPTPEHAVVVGPSTAAPPPKPVVSEQSTAPTVELPAPRISPAPPVSPSTSDVATPPPAARDDTTVVVDIPIPDFPPPPEKPQQQDPEPPKPADPDPEPPKPPVLIDPNFKLPEPPKPDPKPVPPTFLPDLPLSPKLPKSPVLIDPVFGP
jgi:hypothetical protein